MATIGNLIVKLTAHTQQFTSRMAKAGRGVTTLRSKVSGLTGKLGGLGALLTGGMVAGGFVAMAKKQMAAIDATAKLSDRIGTTTEDLIGLRHAAELTGAGADALDAGLQTMAKRLGEAARGGGAAKAALGELGLDAERLAAMNPADAFREIAERLQGIEEPGKRAAIAANIFSKANMSLLNTLDLGKDGLADAADEAERLGLMYSRLDAAKVEAANDSMMKLGRSVEGLTANVVVDLADDIEMLADACTDLLPAAAHEIIRAFKYMQLQVTKAVAWIVQAEAELFKSPAWDVLRQFQRNGMTVGLAGALLPGDPGMAPSEEFVTAFSEDLERTIKDLERQLADFDKPKVFEPRERDLNAAGGASAALARRRTGPDFAAVMERGSREAYSAIIRHRFGGNDPQKNVEQLARRQVDQLGRANGILEEIRDRQGEGAEAANLGK